VSEERPVTDDRVIGKRGYPSADEAPDAATFEPPVGPAPGSQAQPTDSAAPQAAPTDAESND
jgi:hypothetical protein